MLKKISTVISLMGMSCIGILAGEVIKWQSNKEISVKSVSGNYLKNEKIQAYIKKLLDSKARSEIIKGPKVRGSLREVAPNVCVYEATYSKHGIKITSNKKDIKNANGIALYRCFISKKDEDVQELPLEVSKIIYEHLQEKYNEHLRKKYQENLEKTIKEESRSKPELERALRNQIACFADDVN